MPSNYCVVGGFGYVYLVEDEMTGQLRALKHMIMQTRESRESTMREINLQVRNWPVSCSPYPVDPQDCAL